MKRKRAGQKIRELDLPTRPKHRTVNKRCMRPITNREGVFYFAAALNVTSPFMVDGLS
jgi:hypothetical protein